METTHQYSVIHSQHTELDELQQDFSDVLYNEPSKLKSLNIVIIRKDKSQPIGLAHYHLPQETVYTELQEMEQAGIIEPSTSTWAAPSIPVKKKHGSM